MDEKGVRTVAKAMKLWEWWQKGEAINRVV